MNLIDKDKKYVWHPFTQMKDWMEEDIIVVDRAEGVWLYDIDGNKYMDGVSSLWVNVFGHRKKEIDDAILRQLEKMAHSTFLGLSHPAAIELAEKLVRIIPSGLEKVFYSDNGSSAMEIALKMAYQYWQQKEGGRFASRKKFIKFTGAYHGDTIGSVSLGGMDLFHKIYKPLLFDSFTAPYPYSYRFNKSGCDCAQYCLSELESILKSNPDEIAAVVIEPEVQGADGMIMTPPGYMAGLQKLVREYGTLLICDEVATGFGRTGEMFACDIEGITPDIMTVAKSVTGGYLPLAATLTTEEVFSAFLGDYAEKKTFFHGHTYTANPLACAAAIANLDIYENENLLDNVKERSKEASTILKKFNQLEHVGDIRQKGLMIGIELVKDKNTKEDYSWEDKTGIKVIKEARKHQVIIRPLGNVIVLMPPMCISSEELNHLIEATYESILKVTQN